MEKGEKGNREKTYRIYTVRLDGLHFKANHGCLESEKEYGNSFKVDFCGEYSSCAGSTDSLEDAVDYGKVYDCISSVMNGPRCNLLETLAAGISDSVSGTFPEFIRFEVSVAKKNPPVKGKCEWSVVRIEWKKDE